MLSKDMLGMKFPVQLDGRGDLATIRGLDLEKADNLLLLSIERGEVPWDFEYGTRLRQLIHGKVSSEVAAKAIAFREATDVINTYNPNFKVISTGVSFQDERVRVSVQYVERDTLKRDVRNLVVEVPK